MAKKLSKSAKKRYIELGGIKCPFCLSDHIEAGKYYPEANFIYQDVSCLDCHEDWSDQYTLTDIEVNGE